MQAECADAGSSIVECSAVLGCMLMLLWSHSACVCHEGFPISQTGRGSLHQVFFMSWSLMGSRHPLEGQSLRLLVTWSCSIVTCPLETPRWRQRMVLWSMVFEGVFSYFSHFRYIFSVIFSVLMKCESLRVILETRAMRNSLGKLNGKYLKNQPYNRIILTELLICRLFSL